MGSKYIAFTLSIFIFIPNINAGFECIYDMRGFRQNHYNEHPGYKCKIENKLVLRNGIYGLHLDGKADKDVIHVEFNQIASLKTFDSTFCQKFPNLKSILIKYSNLTNIEEDALENCKNLNRILVSDTQLNNLKMNLLSKSSDLMLFAIESSEIASIPENLFKTQKELKEISFHDNKLSELSVNVFSEQFKLEKLFLGNNKIKTLNSLLFQNLYSLLTLVVGSNQISELPETIFNSCINLKELSISNNKIEIVNAEWFRNQQKLEILLLKHNRIISLQKDNFKYLTNLQQLDINNNQIQFLDPNCFRGLESLKLLGIGSNGISDLPPGVFAPLKNLDNLGIDRNQLKIIHSDSFGDNGKLDTLNIGENGIIAIDERILSKTALRSVDMIGNNCKSVRVKEENIRTDLKQCFDNYEPREAQDLSLPSTLPSTHATCGKQTMGIGTVVGGREVAKGSFPWTAALLRSNGDFFCGATLFSNTKVITAAHCIEEKFRDTKLRPRDILVLLGVHDLKILHEVGRVPFAVKTILIHPDWHPRIQSYDADIAVLELDGQVHFNNFIQPICLAAPESAAASVSLGLVVGFGRSEFSDVENVARKINIPIHSYRTCAESSDHESLLSHRAICGGFANGTGVCVGDSGSGLIVKRNGAFYLRGIVSASLHGDQFGCNVHAYSVFTDTTKFHDWILSGKTIGQGDSDRNLQDEVKRLKDALSNLGGIWSN